MGPSQNMLPLGTSARTLPRAKALSASLTSLENVSTSFKSHLWVSFFKFSKQKGVVATTVPGAQLQRSPHWTGRQFSACSHPFPTSWERFKDKDKVKAGSLCCPAQGLACGKF